MAKKKEIKTLDDLKLDEKNFNKHTSEGMKLLRQSIERNKLGRSVLVDKDGNLIAGNGVTETLMGMPEKPNIKVVDTDGSELVVVRRTDLEIDSREARELAMADNAVAYQNLSWDKDNLQKVVTDFGIKPEEWKVNGWFKDVDENEVDGLFHQVSFTKELGLVLSIKIPADYDFNEVKARILTAVAEYPKCKIK